jgi:hypothetical protein
MESLQRTDQIIITNLIRCGIDNIYESKILTMNKVKFLKSKLISLNGRVFKPYLIGDLPQRFAFIWNEYDEQDGITEWFNYKGLTYVPKN